jgi:hypothetical protein
MARPRPDQADLEVMERPGWAGQQPCEPAPEAITVAMDAAALFALDPKEAIATVLLAADPVSVALAACRLLGAAIEGLDRVNGAVNLSEQP